MVLTRPNREPTGLTPNIALRLAHLAPSGTVLVSDATRQLLEQHIAFEPVEPWVDGPEIIPVKAAFTMIGEKHTEATSLVANGQHPLVGRQTEYEMLYRMWAAARRGEGGSVMMTGEPGIGKSRLAYEIRILAAYEEGLVLDCRCLPEHQNNALYPILELLKRHLHLSSADSAASANERLQAALHGGHWPVEVAMPILCSWLSLPLPSPFSPVQYAPNRQKQILFDVLEHLLFNRSDRQPCMLIVEDLHWIDLTSVEWLDRLVQSAPDRPLLLLFTARPEGFESVPWPPERMRTIALQGLASEQAKAMIHQVLDGQPIAEEALARLSERVDGMPLFIEELIHMLLGREVLTDF